MSESDSKDDLQKFHHKKLKIWTELKKSIKNLKKMLRKKIPKPTPNHTWTHPKKNTISCTVVDILYEQKKNMC